MSLKDLEGDIYLVSPEQMAQLKADPDWVSIPGASPGAIVPANGIGYHTGATIIPYAKWAAPKMNRAARRRKR